MDKVALLEAVAERWNREKVPYAIAHGLEDYPDRVGRDLDVLAGSGQARRAIDIAHDVLERHGLLVMRPPRLWGERLVAAALPPESDLLEVHAVDAISWGCVCLAAEPAVTRHIGPFAVDAWAGFAKRVLLPGFAGQIPKMLADLERHPLEKAEAAEAGSRLAAIVGAPLARCFQQALQDRDEPRIARILARMRTAATRQACMRRPAAVVARLGKGFWRRLAQLFSPCGPVVCIVGPPGSGKTSLQEAICQGDRLVFTRCVAARWASPREPAATRMQHWQRLAQHLVRGAVRSLITDRLHSSRQRLVVYEGSALDLTVNPRQFGLRSGAGAELCWQLLPKPDLLVLLDLPETVVRRRRPEVSTEQVARDYSSWRSLAAKMGSVVVIRGDRPLDELRARVTGLIVRTFVMKNGAPVQALV